MCEVLNVMSYQCQVVRQCRARNQQIDLGCRAALIEQRRADLAEGPGDLMIDGENSQVRKQANESL